MTGLSISGDVSNSVSFAYASEYFNVFYQYCVYSTYCFVVVVSWVVCLLEGFFFNVVVLLIYLFVVFNSELSVSSIFCH